MRRLENQNSEWRDVRGAKEREKLHQGPKQPWHGIQLQHQQWPHQYQLWHKDVIIILSSSSVVQVFATMESDIIKHHSCLTWIDLEKMCACIFGFNILHDVLIWFMIVNQSSSRWPQPQQMTGDFLLEPPMAPPVTFDKACFVTKLGSVTKNERERWCSQVYPVCSISKKARSFTASTETNSKRKSAGFNSEVQHEEKKQGVPVTNIVIVIVKTFR